VLTPFFAEDAPQNRNVLAQIVFFDDRVGPDLPHQFVFFDYFSAILDQKQKRLENLRRERDLFAAFHQKTFDRVNAKFAEFVNVGLRLIH
jgi:hypothetical protein